MMFILPSILVSFIKWAVGRNPSLSLRSDQTMGSSNLHAPATRGGGNLDKDRHFHPAFPQDRPLNAPPCALHLRRRALDLRSHAGALETAGVGTLDACFLPHRRRRRMHRKHDPTDVAHPHRNLIPRMVG